MAILLSCSCSIVPCGISDIELFALQVKLYGSWLSVPEGQILKVEEDFCNLKESSGPNIIVSDCKIALFYDFFSSV